MKWNCLFSGAFLSLYLEYPADKYENHDVIQLTLQKYLSWHFSYLSSEYQLWCKYPYRHMSFCQTSTGNHYDKNNGSYQDC